MTTTYIGELTLAVAVPGADAAALAGAAGINAALPDILARIDALLAFSPAPIDFTVQLSQAQAIVTSIQAAISLGIPVPSIADQIAQIAALIAELLNTVTTINAQLSIVMTFLSLLATGGVHAYAYAGQVGSFGADLTAALAGGVPGGSGPTQACNALVLATTSGATWSVMGQIFKVTP